MKIAVSILNSNYDELETIKRVNETEADFLHVDVMDGKFVLNKTPKYEHLYESKKKLNVHLMVSDPFKFISEYSLLNTESIIFHTELDYDIDGLLDYIKSMGLKCGLAINPNTSPNRLLPYIDKLDYVLIMTVIPGKGGQKLLESTIYKIDIFKKMREERKLHFEIIVDGGINADTINKVKNADIVVSGSYICKSEDYNARISTLLDSLN